MKRLLSLLGFLLVLSACGGESSVTTCNTFYWDGTVGVCVPEAWHTVERAELDQRGVPAEVLVAFQSDQPHGGQFATVTVTREALTQPMSSTEYSAASVQSVAGLPNFTKIDQTTISIDAQDVTLHVFSAQPREDQPESRFTQVSAVADGAGYTFTAATPVTVQDALEAEITSMMKSITFKAPEGAATSQSSVAGE